MLKEKLRYGKTPPMMKMTATMTPMIRPWTRLTENTKNASNIGYVQEGRNFTKACNYRSRNEAASDQTKTRWTTAKHVKQIASNKTPDKHSRLYLDVSRVYLGFRNSLIKHSPGSGFSKLHSEVSIQ